MKTLYKNLEEKWFKIPEKMRYLAVGVFNTIAAYVIFVFLYYLLCGYYGLALILQNTISVNISILNMRYFVFHSHGNLGQEYRRAARVYAFMIVLNYSWLFFADKILHMYTPISQAIFIVTSTILTYFLHKYFSFRK
jgi:putative flippase GtrA